MIILLDQDGVIADYAGRLLEIFHERHPNVPRLPNSEMKKSYKVYEHYPKKYWDYINSIVLEENFIRSIKQIEGAIAGVQALLKFGIDVRICTSPNPVGNYILDEKREWIRYYLGDEMAKWMVLTRDKTLIRGDILIDDKPHISGSLTPSWEHVLFNQPYNKDVANKRRLDWSNFKTVLRL